MPGDEEDDSVFPSTTKIYGLLQLYAQYIENYDENSLILLYAPYLDVYFNQTYVRREQAVYHIFYDLRQYAQINELQVNILMPSVFIETLPDSTARVSFMIIYSDKTPSPYSRCLVIFKKLIINTSYQIIGEEYVRCDDSDDEDIEWDYSPADQTEWQDDTTEEEKPAEVPLGKIKVPAGKSIQEAIYDQCPWIKEQEEKYGVGGAKLIGEASADKDKMPRSRFDQDTTICIHPDVILRLCRPTNPDYIYHLVCNNYIWIPECVINSDGWSEFIITVVIYNPTHEPRHVFIPRGTMFEAVNEDVQNVTSIQEYQETIPPHESKEIRVRAVCAAEKRGSPTGSKARVTPYALTQPASRSYYSTQQSVWDHQKEQANNRMVFYIWGKNRRFPDGHVSRMGHAFVYVPGIGYMGFGHRSSVPRSVAYMLTNKMDGVVFDHRNKRQYATDSCVVYITDTQLEHVQALLLSRIKNTPPYRLARYDCTSFAMDMADAAGIYYGKRWGIQSPEWFMHQIKKYNAYKR